MHNRLFYKLPSDLQTTHEVKLGPKDVATPPQTITLLLPRRMYKRNHLPVIYSSFIAQEIMIFLSQLKHAYRRITTYQTLLHPFKFKRFKLLIVYFTLSDLEATQQQSFFCKRTGGNMRSEHLTQIITDDSISLKLFKLTLHSLIRL